MISSVNARPRSADGAAGAPDASVAAKPWPTGWMIAVAAAAAFLATFNETFLNVAFTPIMADFDVDVNTVQWLTTA